MSRTAEIRDRLTDAPQLESWISDLLSRLPLDDTQIDTPTVRFAGTVKISRTRTKFRTCEPWFDRTTPSAPLEPVSPPCSPSVEVVYPNSERTLSKPHWRRRMANHLMAAWWRCTGQGASAVVWSAD